MVEDEAELVRRSTEGDGDAFSVLVLRYETPINKLVSRYVRDTDEASDVTQRVFIRAYERIDSFRGESSFRTWLHRIAVRMALNHIRGQRTFEDVEVTEIPAFTSSLDTSRLVAGEVWRRVSAFLKDLPPQQRLIVEMRLFHDLSFAEIAACADCSEGAARSSFHHGLKRIRAAFPQG